MKGLTRVLAARIWLFASSPIRKIGKWFWRLALMQKICIVLAGLSMWFFSRLRIEPVKTQLPTWFIPGLLIVGGAIMLAFIISLIVWKRRAAKQAATQRSVADSQSNALPADPKRPEPFRQMSEAPKKKSFSAVGMIILALILAGLLYLVFWGQIFATVKMHGRGDGAMLGTREARIETIGPGYFRIHMPPDLGWDPTRKFWPGDQLQITVEQPEFRMRDPTGGLPLQKTVIGTLHSAANAKLLGYRYVTPEDLAPGSMYDFIAQTLPANGLLLKYGENGIVRFCGRGGYYTCPGGIRQLIHPSDPPEMLFAINLRQTPRQRELLDLVPGAAVDTVVFTVKVVHSKHHW